MPGFSKQQYKDENGKTPSDYICDYLLKGDKHVNDALILATYIQQIPNGEALFGDCLYRHPQSNMEIWCYSKGLYHMMYSYYREKKEVCFLLVFNGDPKIELSGAIQRLKNFYGLS